MYTLPYGWAWITPLIKTLATVCARAVEEVTRRLAAIRYVPS